MVGTVEMKQSVLFLTEEDFLPVGRALSAVKGFEDFSEDDLLVITQALRLEKLPFEKDSLNLILFVSRSVELPGGEWLIDIIKVLKPGGTIIVQSSLAATDHDGKSSSSVERKLLLAGFVEINTVNLRSVRQPEDGPLITMKAKKASWVTGSSFSLKKRVLPKIQMDNDSDLIDEDSLLTEEDLKKPDLPLVGDCEVGSMRKACKNCTCGRAEEEEKVQKLAVTSELLENPKSACGSCGLGDAFRCGTCPYRGLPPFKLGEKVALPGSFFSADI
ncbi:cytokine-induced anti-apoptosis inhibitor 1, Fe-S biogenesi isoform X2 [Wolffia australiana]